MTAKDSIQIVREMLKQEAPDYPATWMGHSLEEYTKEDLIRIIKIMSDQMQNQVEMAFRYFGGRDDRKTIVKNEGTYRARKTGEESASGEA